MIGGQVPVIEGSGANIRGVRCPLPGGFSDYCRRRRRCGRLGERHKANGMRVSHACPTNNDAAYTQRWKNFNPTLMQ